MSQFLYNITQTLTGMSSMGIVRQAEPFHYILPLHLVLLDWGLAAAWLDLLAKLSTQDTHHHDGRGLLATTLKGLGDMVLWNITCNKDWDKWYSAMSFSTRIGTWSAVKSYCNSVILLPSTHSYPQLNHDVMCFMQLCVMLNHVITKLDYTQEYYLQQWVEMPLGGLQWSNVIRSMLSSEMDRNCKTNQSTEINGAWTYAISPNMIGKVTSDNVTGNSEMEQQLWIIYWWLSARLQ